MECAIPGRNGIGGHGPQGPHWNVSRTTHTSADTGPQWHVIVWSPITMEYVVTDRSGACGPSPYYNVWSRTMECVVTACSGMCGSGPQWNVWSRTTCGMWSRTVMEFVIPVRRGMLSWTLSDIRGPRLHCHARSLTALICLFAPTLPHEVPVPHEIGLGVFENCPW